MLKIEKHGIVLAPTSLPFENLSTFNPGILQEGNTVHVVYRALNDKFISSLGYAKLDGPLNVVKRWEEPFMAPKYNYEKKGIEDPRITKIGKEIFMTYVVHDGKHAQIAYSSGTDLFNLQRGGIISPRITYAKAEKLFSSAEKLKDDYNFFASFYKEHAARDVLVWEKDGMFFPEKIKRKYAFIHRVLPDMQMALAGDLKEYADMHYWVDHLENLDKHVILEGRYGFEARHVGGGAPPIKTKVGWLIIYHAAEPRNTGRIYTAGAAILDLKNPRITVARLPYPLIEPKESFERKGHVHDVVFPTGTAIFDNRLYIYYGSADTFTSVASVRLDNLLDELMKHKNK
jgi:beta-1,2-mannobiose phosphorylase / 1,2-beta-oligomannan phosphorylase